MGGQIGIYEKSQNIQILRENCLIQRESKQTKKGCEYREIEIRIYI